MSHDTDYQRTGNRSGGTNRLTEAERGILERHFHEMLIELPNRSSSAIARQITYLRHELYESGGIDR